MTEGVHILGVRHHGPGSAASVLAALESLQPDCVLVEGPPDAAEILPLAAEEAMTPPVAILIYAPQRPGLAVYYPFAAFSPEWQAIRWALARGVPVRFMDLPAAHSLAAAAQVEQAAESAQGPPPAEACSPRRPVAAAPAGPAETPVIDYRRDPLAALAEAAGCSDSERWWDHMVESRRDGAGVFGAIAEAMAALREGESPDAPRDPEEPAREAHMRQTIRAAKKEGFARVAVVCGAWHVPALAELPPAGKDAAVLKGLAKVKVACTWVPWTYPRLTFASGYGAGVASPGWYEHLWTVRRAGLSAGDSSIHWLTRVARLMREEDLDVSSAHVIEAVRLAEAVSAMRGRPLPGLPEFSEACRAVFCFGDALPLSLVHQKLIVGEAMGAVPEAVPTVPLQRDLEAQQKRLRLKPEPLERVLDLDLRNQMDLDRSRLLHRLNLLSVRWGRPDEVRGKAGTFHEVWRVQWEPEDSLAVIEAGVWGNTVLAAAEAWASDAAAKARLLPELTRLLEAVLLADLPGAAAAAMTALGDLAAVSSDTAHLMEAMVPLANILRYGSVRQSDAGMIAHVVDGLIARVCIGLGGACSALDDEAAAAMLERIERMDAAITILQNQPWRDAWLRTLTHLSDQQGLHGLLAGRGSRLLMEAGRLEAAEAARRMGLALSLANDPAAAAAWIEGFLRGSGLLLLHDEGLWGVLDDWVARMAEDAFIPVLPLLRRTFAHFPAPERRQIGERARHEGRRVADRAAPADVDAARAEAVLPLVLKMLGLPAPGPEAATTGGGDGV